MEMDDQKILELRDSIKRAGQFGRSDLEREWYLKILFYVGRQWIMWNTSAKKWDPVPNNTPWAPMLVTNRFASAADTIKSVLTQRDPRFSFVPLDARRQEDMATAEIADTVSASLEKETYMEKVRRLAASWGVIAGDVFAHSYYDNSEDHGMTAIQLRRCKECNYAAGADEFVGESGPPHCPKCGNGKIEPAFREDGVTPLQVELPIGKVATEILSPFECFFNNEIRDFSECRQIVMSKMMELKELKRLYPEFAEKITPVGQGQGDGGGLNQYYLSSLAYVTTTAQTGVTGIGGTSGAGSRIERAVMDRMIALPCEDFPYGLCAEVIGNIVVNKQEIWSIDGQGNPYMPVANFGMMNVPGRVWHKTPLDDLIRKQVQRNKIESFIYLEIMRMSASHWLVPTGTNPDPITGEPGQRISFTPGLKGEKPERLQGMSLPNGPLNYLQQIDRDFEELAATFDALKGQIPKGLKNFSGLKLLTERGLSRFNEPIKNWEDFNKVVKTHQIEIARNHMTEPRLRTIRQQFGNWETKEFNKNSLNGSISVEVEAGSSMPRSHAAEQALLMELAQDKIIDLNDPKIKYIFMERLGQADLGGTSDTDFKDAVIEWKEFVASVKDFAQEKSNLEVKEASMPPAQAAMPVPMAAAVPPIPGAAPAPSVPPMPGAGVTPVAGTPPTTAPATPSAGTGSDRDLLDMHFKVRFRPEIDNHAIHFMEHVQRAKSPEFFALPEEAQKFWIQHAMEHKSEMMKAQAAQQPQGRQGPQKGAPQPHSNGKSRLEMRDAKPVLA